MILDTEAAVLANFEFLSQAEEMDEDEDLSDDWDEHQPELSMERGGALNKAGVSLAPRCLAARTPPLLGIIHYCDTPLRDWEVA